MPKAIGVALLVVCRLASADPAAPFPAEVAGFRFGLSVPEFEAQCKKVGKPSALVREIPGMRYHTCDAVEVQPGWRWSVFAGFCERESRLCEVNYFSNNQHAPGDYGILSALFTQRYGVPSVAKGNLREDGLEGACAKGDGLIGRSWRWRTAAAGMRRLLLTFSCNHAQPMLAVLFDDALGAAIRVKPGK